MPPNSAPVDRVGGTQEQGPWPESVEEIVEGEQYDRPVHLDDGSVATVTVTIVDITEITDRDGNPTGAYAVRFTHEGGA